MPTYDFVCPRGHAHEAFFKISAVPDAKPCTTCKRKARRQMGAGGAAMCKGKGFYSTDNRSAKYKAHKHMHAEMEKMEKRLHVDQ